MTRDENAITREALEDHELRTRLEFAGIEGEPHVD